LPYTRGLEAVSRGHIWKRYSLYSTKNHILFKQLYTYNTIFRGVARKQDNNNGYETSQKKKGWRPLLCTKKRSTKYLNHRKIISQGLTKGQANHRPARQLGTQTRYWDSREYGACKFRLSHDKAFSENYPRFGHAPSKMVASPVLGWKIFKKCRFEGVPNY